MEPTTTSPSAPPRLGPLPHAHDVARDVNGLEIIGREECLRLLASVPIGRVGTSLRTLPAILPVHHVVAEGDIVFRTNPGTKFSAAIRNAVIAYEADDFDVATRTGWSVMAIGEAREITDHDELAWARSLPLEPWIPQTPERYVRLYPVHLSGRRITPA